MVLRSVLHEKVKLFWLKYPFLDSYIAYNFNNLDDYMHALYENIRTSIAHCNLSVFMCFYSVLQLVILARALFGGKCAYESITLKCTTFYRSQNRKNFRMTFIHDAIALYR